MNPTTGSEAIRRPIVCPVSPRRVRKGAGEGIKNRLPDRSPTAVCRCSGTARARFDGSNAEAILTDSGNGTFSTGISEWVVPGGFQLAGGGRERKPDGQLPANAVEVKISPCSSCGCAGCGAIMHDDGQWDLRSRHAQSLLAHARARCGSRHRRAARQAHRKKAEVVGAVAWADQAAAPTSVTWRRHQSRQC